MCWRAMSACRAGFLGRSVKKHERRLAGRLSWFLLSDCSAGQADLDEPIARDSAETRVARLRRLDEELHVEAVPRLRERLVRHERERHDPIGTRRSRLARDDT